MTHVSHRVKIIIYVNMDFILLLGNIIYLIFFVLKFIIFSVCYYYYFVNITTLLQIITYI